jgi:hypothetical protein
VLGIGVTVAYSPLLSGSGRGPDARDFLVRKLNRLIPASMCEREGMCNPTAAGASRALEERVDNAAFLPQIVVVGSR